MMNILNFSNNEEFILNTSNSMPEQFSERKKSLNIPEEDLKDN
jgi:hypothetical protein